jgi:hypothetical protein
MRFRSEAQRQALKKAHAGSRMWWARMSPEEKARRVRAGGAGYLRGEDAPLIWDPFQALDAPVAKAQPRAGHQIFHRARHENFARPSERGDRRA